MVKKMALHRFVDRAKINEAIVNAERETDAPIVVSLSPYFWGDVRRTAERAFRRHRLNHTPERNAVLFFVVPSRRRFVLIGDAGAHEKFGQHVWDAVAADVERHFCSGDPTAGLVYGISEIGRHLARHYPRKHTPNGPEPDREDAGT
jgi:uncharacterized membrane protein